jgi:hypothetical protein
MRIVSQIRKFASRATGLWPSRCGIRNGPRPRGEYAAADPPRANKQIGMQDPVPAVLRRHFAFYSDFGWR